MSNCELVIDPRTGTASPSVSISRTVATDMRPPSGECAIALSSACVPLCYCRRCDADQRRHIVLVVGQQASTFAPSQNPIRFAGVECNRKRPDCKSRNRAQRH